MKFSLLTAVLLAFVAPLQAEQKATFTPVITKVGKDTVTVKTGANRGYIVTGVGDNGLPKREAPANVETYSVNQWTKITLNDKPASMSDLKKGMEVRVTQGLDRKVVATIAAKQPL